MLGDPACRKAPVICFAIVDTAIATDVTLGNNYNLGVVINIDGPVDVYTRVWTWDNIKEFIDSL